MKKSNWFFATADEMSQLDAEAVRHGLDILQMMELAGWHMVKLCQMLKIPKSAPMTVVCGKGNKAGDGFSAARHLIHYGWKVNIVFLSRKMSPSAAHQFRILQKMPVPIFFYRREKKRCLRVFQESRYFIDALIGYRLSGAPRSVFAEVIEIINALPGKTIAYDIPTGLHPTTGFYFDPAIQATATLTLGLPKRAFLVSAARAICGKIFLGDIGIPPVVYDTISKGSRPPFHQYPGGLIPLPKKF